MLGAFEFRNFAKRYDGGPKETELLERRRGYDAILGGENNDSGISEDEEAELEHQLQVFSEESR